VRGASEVVDVLEFLEEIAAVDHEADGSGEREEPEEEIHDRRVWVKNSNRHQPPRKTARITAEVMNTIWKAFSDMAGSRESVFRDVAHGPDRQEAS
jgi:hypothetical protein